MIVMPIVAALNEKKKAEKKGKPQVSSRPFYLDTELDPEIKEELEGEFDFVPEYNVAPKPVEVPKPIVKPIVTTPIKIQEEPTKEHFSKKLTEAQKLVVYSEIMRPKFEK